MLKSISTFLFAAAVLAPALDAAPAQAQLARTFVSAAIGNDANNCDRPTPCRTFQGAHDKTNPDGEITVLDAGGYGALTITKSISVVNEGAGESSVLVSGGATGITVNGGGASYVNLRGITIQGIGFGGGTGLRFNSGFTLTMTNCVVRNHTGNGIEFFPSVDSRLSVADTLVADNGGSGIVIQPTFPDGARAVLDRVGLYNNSVFGLLANGAASPGAGLVHVGVFASVAAHNGNAGFVSRSPIDHAMTGVQVIGSMSADNSGPGFLADQLNGTMTVGASSVMGNLQGAASGHVFSFGDNYSQYNQVSNTFPNATPKS